MIGGNPRTYKWFSLDDCVTETGCTRSGDRLGSSSYSTSDAFRCAAPAGSPQTGERWGYHMGYLLTEDFLENGESFAVEFEERSGPR